MMDGKMLARLVAVAATAVAVTAAAVHFARDDGSAGVPATPPAVTETPPTNPLRDTLRHCQQMGEAATRDADCLAAWDESRKRFLAPAGGR